MRRGRPRHPELLTPREQEVLSLIREGLTNDQIASRLGISESGARYHVSEILSKLGVSSRVEAARWKEGAVDQRSRSIFGLSAVRVTRGLAAAAIAVALVGLLAIAVGVGVIRLRADGESAVPEEPSGRELAGFLTLAREASDLADAKLPGSSLYIVFAYPDDDTYIFRFSDPAWQHEAVVEGPHRNEPSLPVWSVTVNQFPEGMQPLETVDLSGLLHSPADVDAIARSALIDLASGGYCGSPYKFLVALGRLNGQLSWDAKISCPVYVGSHPSPDMGCQMPDTDLTNMTCKR